MNRKKKGFVPMIDVETGASDALIVQERQGLLKTMDDEKAKQLMEHLKKQWIFSISALGPDLLRFAPRNHRTNFTQSITICGPSPPAAQNQ